MTKTELMKLTDDMKIEYAYSLYKCRADVLRPRYGNQFLILRSYTTRVGLADFETNTFYLFGYYSATTTQHAHKFIKWLKENYSRDFKIVRLEYYSNTPKRIINELVNCDYETLINVSCPTL